MQSTDKPPSPSPQIFSTSSFTAHPLYVSHRLVLHGVKVSAGVLQQGPEDEGEADAQVNIYGLNEAVGVGQGGPGPHHQSGHGQDCGHSCGTERKSFT